MIYYIGTKQQCEDYNQEVTHGENYRGGTTTWANILEHPTESKCAIVAHEKYPSQLETIESLNQDWYADLLP